MPSLFSGITVLDLTKVYSGPLATRYLADHGATVIKIETEEHPDPTRFFPPLKRGASGYFEILNRNKHSRTLNLKNETDYATFVELVKTADVIVENMVPSTKKKLHITYDEMKHHNPTIIYASLAGIDQKTDTKYYDIIAQAESGLMSLSGTPEMPAKIGPAIVDAFSGSNLAFAISSALYYRQKTGHGQNVSVSMLGAAINMLEQNLIEYSVTKINPNRPGNQDTAIAPFGVFKTKDSSIVLAIGDENMWNQFVSLSDKYSILTEEIFATNQKRLEHLTELVTHIEHIFSEYSTHDLITTLQANGIPCSTIREMSDVASDSWFIQSGALKRILHPQLGEIVVPGSAVIFSEESDISYQHAPALESK